MPAFYIQVGPNLFYKFNASAAAYPAAIIAALGITNATPAAPNKVTRAGTFADHGIMRVRMPIVSATGVVTATKIRLCDVDTYSGATTALAGATAFGGSIEGVYPVRKRVFL